MREGEINKIFGAGAIDVVNKPLDDGDFISRVKAALAFHDALKEIKEREDEVLEINTFTEAGEVILTKRNELQELKASVEKLQSELESKQQRLVLQTELLIHSKNIKSNLFAAMHKLQPYVTSEGKAKFTALLKQIHWELNDEEALQFERDFDQLHETFYGSLETYCPGITKNEKRLCVYVKMNHCASDIARITSRSLNSISVALARLRSKLQVTSSKDLRNLLIDMS